MDTSVSPGSSAKRRSTSLRALEVSCVWAMLAMIWCPCVPHAPALVAKAQVNAANMPRETTRDRRVGRRCLRNFIVFILLYCLLFYRVLGKSGAVKGVIVGFVGLFCGCGNHTPTIDVKIGRYTERDSAVLSIAIMAIEKVIIISDKVTCVI